MEYHLFKYYWIIFIVQFYLFIFSPNVKYWQQGNDQAGDNSVDSHKYVCQFCCDFLDIYIVN